MTDRGYSVAEYETGWVVERPREGSATEAADFVTVRGPFKHKATAERWLGVLQGRSDAPKDRKEPK